MARSLGWAILWLAVFACFTGWALHPPGNLDIDWYLLGARTLLSEGGELYTTIRDPNPPAVWQLFLAVEWLARETGLPAHHLFYVLSALAGLSLLAWTAAILPRPLRAATLLGGAFFGAFAAFAEAGQRDVLAALMVLPYLAWTQRLSEAVAPERWQGSAATFVAGLALLLKPHFVIYFLFAEALLAWRRRNNPPSPLAGARGARARSARGQGGRLVRLSTNPPTDPPHPSLSRKGDRIMTWPRDDLLWPALLIMLLGAAQLALHPAYLVYLETYGAFYLGWAAAPLSSRTLVTLLMLAAAIGAVVVNRRQRSWMATLAWAGLAAVACALVQDKWWDYQTHPIILFTGLAWSVLLAEPLRAGWRGLLWAILAAPAVWLGGIALESAKDHWRAFVEAPVPPAAASLAAAIDRLAPAAPIAILGSHSGAIAAYISGATWALSEPPFWVVQQVGARRLAGEPLDAVEAEAEHRYLAELAVRVERQAPALLAIHRGGPREPDALAYLRLDSRLAQLLDNRYAPAGEVAGFSLFLPRR